MEIVSPTSALQNGNTPSIAGKRSSSLRDEPPVLTAEQIESWRTLGFALVDNILPADLLSRVCSAMRTALPDDLKAGDKGCMGFDSGIHFDTIFPSIRTENKPLNDVPLCRRLIKAVCQLLECDASGLRLAQCQMWAKCGVPEAELVKNANFEQRVHIDGHNHYLVVPPDWDSPEAVAIILYYDDSEEVAGCTNVVPRFGRNDPAYHTQQPEFPDLSTTVSDGSAAAHGVIVSTTPAAAAVGTRMDNGSDISNGATAHTLTAVHTQQQTAQRPTAGIALSTPFLLTPGGRGDLPWINGKIAAEAYFTENHPEIAQFRQNNLYSREVVAKYSVGTCLFYRLDTWHRGTPVLPGKVRRIQNILYKRAGCDWINNWNAGPAKSMYESNRIVERMIASSTMDQRVVLGFPSAESSYWTEATLRAVRERYDSLPPLTIIDTNRNGNSGEKEGEEWRGGGMVDMGAVEEAVKNRSEKSRGQKNDNNNR